MSDELHDSQRKLRGVARTKLSFVSDRNRESVLATVEKRDVKEIYVVGLRRREPAAHHHQPDDEPVPELVAGWALDRLHVVPVRRARPADLEYFRGHDGDRRPRASARTGCRCSRRMATRLAFISNRDGNSEIYVMNRDGSNLTRLTNNQTIDSTPTWSPSGTQIAFTSERTGTPQIYVIGADGSGLRRISSESFADRATWSPAPYNEIAFAARTGPGFDIKILNIGTGETRQITFGEGSNESPAWSPNGRHLAFMSTRAGRSQIFTVDRDGKNLRQLTRDGNNTTPPGRSRSRVQGSRVQGSRFSSLRST